MPEKTSTKPDPRDDIRDAETEVRTGSPFKSDPLTTSSGSIAGGRDAAAAVPEMLDVGAGRTTAIGAVWASAIILLFAAAALWTFPSGGTIVSGLGSLLAVIGLASPYVKSSLVCLVGHLGLFIACFTVVNGG